MDNLNFPLILVVATAVTGIVWLVDALAFAPRRRASVREDVAGHEPIVVEYAKSFFPVLLIVLVLRSFVFEPFRIPSGSMIPTLLIGDFILVSKFSYGLRLPVVHTKILETGAPERGDVAVFRFPNDPRQDYIKRVIGLPGDAIEYREQRLFVNGERVCGTVKVISVTEPSSEMFCTIMSTLTWASANGPKTAAATPGLSATRRREIWASSLA